MDTEKIRAFLCVLRCGTISAAAERLGYTTSGVSRIIASLEADAGFPLLKRLHGGVEPTGECRGLIPAMEELLRSAERYDQLTAQVCGLETGLVTVGTAYSAYYRPLADIIAGFTREHPGIRVEIVEGTSSRLCQLLLEGKADLCIISRRPDIPCWIPLGQNELVALTALDHPAVAEGRFSAERLRKEPFIELFPGRETDNSLYFKKLGITPNTRFSTYDVSAGVAMVEAGLGVTLSNNLWGMNMSESVAALPLDPPMLTDIGLATRPVDTLSPAVRSFAEYCRSSLQNDP